MDQITRKLMTMNNTLYHRVNANQLYVNKIRQKDWEELNIV